MTPTGARAESARSIGDPIPQDAVVIEVRVGELKQLFHTMDPSPFREKDLAPEAEEFILGWAREAPRNSTLALRVHLDRQSCSQFEFDELRDAVHAFFAHHADETLQQLRQLFRIGRTSMVIGLTCLSITIVGSDVLESTLGDTGIGGLVRESLLIGGWVAMWRPLEIFLYDWWPIRAEIRLSRRLAAMPVQIVSNG